MSESTEKTSGKKESDSPAKSGGDGEIPCVLVYPDRKHVPYVNNLVNCLEEKLPRLGIKLNKLCERTPADEHLGEKFEKLAQDFQSHSRNTPPFLQRAYLSSEPA